MPAIADKNKAVDLAASLQLGFDLGVLIAGLKVSSEVKDSLGVLLEQATPKQLTALHDALVGAYLMQATKEADAEYENSLRKLIKDFEERQETGLQETEKELNLLAQEVNSKVGGILI